MKKAAGVLLILIGVIIILFSILILVKAFDSFSAMGSTTESIVYTIGNIIFPLLLTVSGRWVFRKGQGLLKGNVQR